MASVVLATSLILSLTRFPTHSLAAGTTNQPHSEYSLYLPLIFDPRPPKVKLEAAWIGDSQGASEVSFHPDEAMGYRIQATNSLTETTTIQLQWIQNDVCGDNSYGLVYNDTLSVDPGEWLHVFPSTTHT